MQKPCAEISYTYIGFGGRCVIRYRRTPWESSEPKLMAQMTIKPLKIRFIILKMTNGTRMVANERVVHISII